MGHEANLDVDVDVHVQITNNMNQYSSAHNSKTGFSFSLNTR
jgi:hypothetical protein